MNERYATVDYHTAGEPFRIVAETPFEILGDDVPAKRLFAIGSPEVQRARQILCFEPRGHADMYGCFLVEPDDDGAHFGVLFWHKDGFSTACGHGTIALGVWAIETGRVAVDPSGSTDVVIDVPSGRVTARVHTDDEGAVVAVDFINVPSYVLAEDVPVSTSRGDLQVDIVFGGAIYAQIDARSAGLSVVPGQAGEIIALGREIKQALDGGAHAAHPEDDRLNGIYGTIVFEDLGGTDAVHQRNATVFADGELDRSPCGSGTSARVAALTESGVLPPGGTLRHGSIVGSEFTASVVGSARVAGRDAVVPQVTGMAFRTGEHVFVVDERDALVPGFVLR
ncbi:proline racemase family protein [Microbacterium hydrocarbonoxydans]|uniref:proline racemase family protein n=1 Tax=Microbacterium hydrocarbonoxydans TaxID=273678 RepID=UPI0013DC2EE6|nr:proline racemase family protein [Microbacterium hydrocarbonoxydans]